jgi:hypothetical protein
MAGCSALLDLLLAAQHHGGSGTTGGGDSGSPSRAATMAGGGGSGGHGGGSGPQADEGLWSLLLDAVVQQQYMAVRVGGDEGEESVGVATAVRSGPCIDSHTWRYV